MVAIVYQRPSLPFTYQSLSNANRYQDITNTNAPPSAYMLDVDINYLIEAVNALGIVIDHTSAGILPGSELPINAGKFPTTDGASDISWTFVTDAHCTVNSIAGNKLLNDSVGTDQLADGSVTNDILAVLSVNTANLIDDCVTSAKIANGAVITAALGVDAVTTAKIADQAVTATQIANNTITAAQIANNTLTAAQIANNTITATQIANQTITAAQISNLTITAAQIANATITATQIAGGVIPIHALKADQITATSTTLFTNPAVQQNHPSAAKFWCSFTTSAGGAVLTSSYNVASVVRNSLGKYTITFTTAFTSANYSIGITVALFGSNYSNGIVEIQNAGSCQISVFYVAGSPASPQYADGNTVFVQGYGLQ